MILKEVSTAFQLFNVAGRFLIKASTFQLPSPPKRAAEGMTFVAKHISKKDKNNMQ
jgi:hypothetical protein